jgi:hypothetical protein
MHAPRSAGSVLHDHPAMTAFAFADNDAAAQSDPAKSPKNGAVSDLELIIHSKSPIIRSAKLTASARSISISPVWLNVRPVRFASSSIMVLISALTIIES